MRSTRSGTGPSKQTLTQQKRLAAAQAKYARTAVPKSTPSLESSLGTEHPLSRDEQFSLAVDAVLNPKRTQLGRDVALSRALAPGPAVSGFHALSALIGPNLAARLPGQLTESGARPGHTGRGTAIDAALLPLPFFRGPRALLAGARAVKEGNEAAQAIRAARLSLAEPGPIAKAYQARKLRYKDLTVQIPKARSKTGALSNVERAIDRASVRLGETERAPHFPGVRLATAGERVTKASGRAQRVALERAQAKVAPHLQKIAKVKEGSPEDVAHFWWAQVPKAFRNTDTLRLVQGKRADELRHIESGAYEAELADRMKALNMEIAHLRKTDPGVRPSTQLNAQDEIRNAVFDIPQLKLDLAASIHQLDDVIAAAPKLDEGLIDSVHALNEERAPLLMESGRLKPETAAARRGIVSRWLGLDDATGEEAYLGHRLPRPERSGVFKGPGGTGSVASPQGVGSENKLVLASQGRLRPTLRVAAEDWHSSQVFGQALKARDDLTAIGDKFTGSVPPGHKLLNRKGKVIPPNMRTAELAQFTEDYRDSADLREQAEKILKGFVAKDADEEEAMKKAVLESGGSFEDLRVVPDRLINRYYSQFRGTHGANAYDKMVDGVALSIVFARIGYIPKNVVQNLIMSVPHQGVFLPSNAIRAAQAMHDADVAHYLRGELGHTATGALGRESTSKKVKRLTGAVTKVSEELLPFRLSAFMHEAAAHGVISKTRPWMNERDKQALLDLFENPKNAELLNDIRSATNEAMADFSRLTPDQMRLARRYLIIPGWLMAGTRYPFHFAANHPVRTALMAYLGAGEPGAPDRLQFNKPLDEYISGSSYRQGIETPLGRIRTGSISPVSTPWELAQAIVGTVRGKTGPFDYTTPSAFDFATPLLAQTVKQLQGEGGTPLERAEQVGRSLVPSASLIADLIHPGEKATYPEDKTRAGRLKRELGVIPIKVSDPDKQGGEGGSRGSRSSGSRSSGGRSKGSRHSGSR